MELVILETIQCNHDLGRWLRTLAASCCRNESVVWWKNPCRLSLRAEQRLWFLLPLMVCLLLKWLILRWKTQIKKMHSPLSKHELNNCNLVYLLWQWRDGNCLLRCWLWMHSLLLLSLLLQALHCLKLSLGMLAIKWNVYKQLFYVVITGTMLKQLPGKLSLD